MVQTALKIIHRAPLLGALFVGTLLVTCMLWAVWCGPIWISADVHDHGIGVNESLLPDVVDISFFGPYAVLEFKKFADLRELVSSSELERALTDPEGHGIPDVLEWGAKCGILRHHHVCREWFLEFHAAFPGAIMFLCLLPVIRSGIRRHRQRRPGLCRNCGYNLTGNVSGRCPECGAATAARAAESSRNSAPQRGMDRM